LVYYLQLCIGSEVILKVPIVKQKVAIVILFGLNGNKLCGKETKIGFVAIAMKKVFESNIVAPYVKVTTYKCHTNIKILEGVVILWSNKFMKLVSDAFVHNANVT
jgi:hypothetical protein